MQDIYTVSRARLLGSSLACALFAAAASANAAGVEKVLYAFKGGNDGLSPVGSLTVDSNGNLFGATGGGGGGTACVGGEGCGTVFKLAPDGTESLVYAFQGGSDGAFPSGTLIADSGGNLYGTTSQGGASDQGTVFKVAPNGAETVLYSFKGGTDGSQPLGALTRDSGGNLYGATYAGGSAGLGTVFEIKAESTETVIHSFEGGEDGEGPAGGIISDNQGNLYGTTELGGSGNCTGFPGCGTVFKIAPGGMESILYAFQGGNDGFVPSSTLLVDTLGNLYGTTRSGGTCSGAGGCGTVFEVAPDGTESVLYSFQGGKDGDVPFAPVIMDKAGDLYGTTYYGGSTYCHEMGCGTVFKLSPGGTETVLFALHGARGSNPAAALVKGRHGVFYGTTSAGGASKDGVVFRIKD